MADPRELYRDQILDHYKHPRNKGKLEPATHAATDTNPLCGDKISLQIRVDDNGCIEAARFEGQGCAISLASASLLTTIIEGKDVRQASALEDETLLETVGVPLSAVRKECALLPLYVLGAALGKPRKAR